MKNDILRKIKGLGWPLLSFSSIALFCICITIIFFGNDFAKAHCVTYCGDLKKSIIGVIFNDRYRGYIPTAGFWFVQDLLYSSIGFVILKRYKIPNILIAAITILVFCFLYYLPIFQLRGWLMHYTIALSFLSMGNYYYENSFSKVNTMAKTKPFLFFVITISLICLTLVISQINPVAITMYNCNIGPFFLFIFGALSGTLSITLFTQFLCSNNILVKLKVNKWIMYMGINSIIFLFMQFYVFQLSVELRDIATTPLPTPVFILVRYIATLIICYLSSYIVNKYLYFFSEISILISFDYEHNSYSNNSDLS